MAKIEKKQSEIEKALNSAYEIYKSSLQAILCVDTLTVEVDIKGVKLSTLAVIVEESDDLQLCIINNCGINQDITRSYVDIDDVSLENNKID